MDGGIEQPETSRGRRGVGTGCLVLAGAPFVLMFGCITGYHGVPMWAVVGLMALAAGLMAGVCGLHSWHTRD